MQIDSQKYNLFVFLVFVFFYVRLVEKKSLFIPFRSLAGTPKTQGLVYQDLSIETPDHQKINAWFIPYDNAKWTIFYLHGNGGNLSHRLPQIAFFHELELNVFIIDYRGYGASSGSPSEKGFYVDALAAYEYLTKALNVLPEHIIVFGESLGAAVAIDLAAKKEVKALILEGAFTSTAEIARRYYKIFPTFLLESRFDSLSKIHNITAPKLFIHSVNDEVVPFDLGKKLFQVAALPKDFFEIHGGHNDCFISDRDILKKRIRDFIK